MIDLDLPDYRNFLREEFLKRMSRNPQYSLRAFANNIGLHPSRVSLIFNHKQGLSKQRALAVGKKLGFETNFLQYFALLAEARHGRSQTHRNLAYKKLKAAELKKGQYHTLSEDTFRLISDWWHVAILQLGALKSFNGKISYITKRLGLDMEIAQMAVDRLVRLGLAKFENNKIEIITPNIATTENIPSKAIRSFHTQIIEKSLQAIEEQSVGERNISALVVPADAEQIKAIVQLINNLKDQVYDETQSHKKKSDVYCLGIQFFKLTKRDGE